MPGATAERPAVGSAMAWLSAARPKGDGKHGGASCAGGARALGGCEATAEHRAAAAAEAVEALVLRLLRGLARTGDGSAPRAASAAQVSVALCDPCHALISEDGRYTAATSRERQLQLTRRNYRRLARLFCALDIIHQLNVAGRSATQRELYYRANSDAAGSLFRCQADMNFSIRDASGALRIGRPHLGIHVTEKGLLAGAIDFRDTHSSQPSSASRAANGLPITESMVSARDASMAVDKAQYILVVEKDTVFQHLLQGCLLAVLPIVLVTGRGYPDVLTRRLLQRLHRMAPGVPQIYLGDYDPHGVAIYLLYLASCPWLHWLGLRRADVEALPAEAALPLTARDEALRAVLLSRPEVVKRPAFSAELLAMGRKFELEAWQSVHGAEHVARVLLPEKLRSCDWL